MDFPEGVDVEKNLPVLGTVRSDPGNIVFCSLPIGRYPLSEIDGLKYVWHDGDIAELFDLRADPYETTNLAEMPERAGDRKRLYGALGAMMKDLDDPLADKAAVI